MMLFAEAQRFETVGRLRHDLDSVLGLQERAHSASHDGMIISQ